MNTTDGFYITSRRLSATQKAGSTRVPCDSRDLTQKYRRLFAECRGGELRGGPADELLTLGGERHLIWIDIDSRDRRTFESWARSPGCPIPRDSMEVVESSTGRMHAYVCVDRPYAQVHCDNIKHYLKERAPASIAGRIDRIYGPRTRQPIYIPGAHRESPTLPQALVSRLKGTWTVPKEAHGTTLYESYTMRLLERFTSLIIEGSRTGYATENQEGHVIGLLSRDDEDGYVLRSREDIAEFIDQLQSHGINHIEWDPPDEDHAAKPGVYSIDEWINELGYEHATFANASSLIRPIRLESEASDVDDPDDWEYTGGDMTVSHGSRLEKYAL